MGEARASTVVLTVGDHADFGGSGLKKKSYATLLNRNES